MERKVMIVDDEPDIRLTVKAVLEPMGFHVLPVENGERCIEELENGFKGVILMDIMMPGMDGWETASEIEKRGLEQGNLVAMLTAQQDPSKSLEEISDCVFHYLTKPFESTDLAAKVSECCMFLSDVEEAFSRS